MLTNIGLENFEMQDGFTIEGNSKSGQLFIMRNEKRTTMVDKDTMESVTADEIVETIKVTTNGIIKNSDKINIVIEKDSIISIYYKKYFIDRELSAHGHNDQISEKNYSIYIDYIDSNGKDVTFILLNQILSKYMSRYIIQEINAILGLPFNEDVESKSEVYKSSADNIYNFLGIDDTEREMLCGPSTDQSEPSNSFYRFTTFENNSPEHIRSIIKMSFMRWFYCLALPCLLWPLVGDKILLFMNLSKYQIKCLGEWSLYACIILLGLIIYYFFQKQSKIFKYCGFEFNADGAVIYEKNLKGDKKLLFNGNVSDIIRVIPYEIKKKPFGVESLADNSRKKNNLLDMLHLTSEEDNEYQKYEKNFFTVVVELTNGNRIMVLPEEPTSFQQAEYIALSVNKHLTSM